MAEAPAYHAETLKPRPMPGNLPQRYNADRIMNHEGFQRFPPKEPPGGNCLQSSQNLLGSNLCRFELAPATGRGFNV